jgi:Ser-tRNA(Ala) deacylase AlaX
MQKAIEEALEAARSRNLPIKVVGDPFSSRAIQIGDFLPAVPCGGTHVESAAEIGRVGVRGIKFKSGQLRIGYSVVPQEGKGG